MSGYSRMPYRLLPMLFVMGLIFVLSGIPGERLVLPDIVNIDKAAHMAVYCLLALTVFWAFGDRLPARYPRLVPLLVILISTAYGVTDEFHQSFVPNRTPSVFDVLADGAGAVLACGLWVIFPNLRKKRG